jgi:predicted helicase
MTKGEPFRHVLVSRTLSEVILLSSKTSNNAFVFPLYKYVDTGSSQGTLKADVNRQSNFSSQVPKNLAARLAMTFKPDGAGDRIRSFGPDDVFHYTYSILYAPTYRSRYSEFLKRDFPRIPFTSDAELFRRLCILGADLVALHVLEDDYEAASWNTSRPKGRSPLIPITRFAGKGSAEVAKGYPKDQDGKVHINPSRYFEGVPQEVWNFHIGGYQVCEKWLKDRRGRTLSDEDINHYQRVVVALSETIRLMAEIDRVMEEHGGWPLVGSQDAPKTKLSDGLPFS